MHILFTRPFEDSEELPGRSPVSLLRTLDRSLREALGQHLPQGETNNGADGAIILWNTHTQSLKYSGARIPLWVQHKEQPPHEIKPSKVSLGYRSRSDELSLAEREINLQPGSRVFLFSDGILDEGAPPSGFSFGKKRLKQVLLENQSVDFKTVTARLNAALDDW